MKLTTFILIVTLVQVSAKGFGQRISLHETNTPLEKVLQSIRKQSGFEFFYDVKDLQGQKITISLYNVSVDEAVKKSIAHLPLSYKIIKNNIVLSRIEPSFLEKVASVFQRDSTINIRGRVLNAEGNPFPGASVSVVFKDGGRIISYTDELGSFKFFANKGNMIIVSSVGYETKRLKITKAEIGDIRMRIKTDSLDEVKVVIGYGTTTKILNTGNVAVVTSDDISKQPVTNVLLALQGRVAGLEVNPTNGFASSPVSLKIRGQNSVGSQGNGGVNKISEPLYIIDGVPVISGAVAQQNVGINQNGFQGPTEGQSPLFGLNPTDVESISVLKDADATAIYGARGANGVILITTKKGKAGKTTVNANVYTGLSLQSKRLNLMNTPQYLEMRKRAFANDGYEPEDYNGYDLRLWDQNRYTDWQKELLGTAHTTDAQLSLSGGDAKTTFRLSGGYNAQTPPFKGDYKEQRASASLNLTNNSMNNRLVTNVMVNFSSTTSNLPSLDLTPLAFLAPNAPALFNDQGQLNFDGWRAAGGLPYQVAYLKKPYSANTINMISNLTLKYHIIPGLDFNSSLGYNLSRQNQLTTTPSGSFDPLSAYAGRSSNFGTNNSRSWIIEPSLTYNRSFGKHNFQTLLGSTFQDTKIDGTNITAQGYTSDALLEDLAAASSYNINSNYLNTKVESLYARINYNYDGKYVINLNGRRDGSSRFASGKQFGDFGSIGAAWIFSEENFVKDHFGFLSLGKIRASYGLVGDDGVGDYQYLSSYTSSYNQYQNTPVLQLSRLANDTFSWTTNKKAEVALSLGFLKGRINTELSLYRNISGNQLVSEPLPSTSGFSSVVSNLPAEIENKGLELTLQTQNIISKNFQWSTNFNISKNQNKLLKFPELENSTYSDSYAIGRSISSIGMLSYAGIDPATKQYTFKDINGDGTVDMFGKTDFIYKNNTPSYFGGMGNNFSYKGFQLSAFFSFAKQKGVLRLSNLNPGSIQSGLGNQLILSDQSTGKPALENLTTATYQLDLFNYYSSDAVWVDASYIRLQNLSFAYNLPAKVLSKAKLQNVKIYVQGQNLLTITGYKGTDPASPGSFSLPIRKIITAGLQFVF